MTRATKARFNPNSIYASQNNELVFVTLSLEHEEHGGEGLHLQSPETYWTWVEEEQERARTEGEILD